jgi:alpha-L-fucosidase
MMNSGFGDGSKLKCDYAWPTDLMAIERNLPSSNRGYQPWHRVEVAKGDAKDYYVPGEACDPIGYEWFAIKDDRPRSDAELLGIRLICRERGVNLLLNVPPGRSGVIEEHYVASLARLAKNVERLGGGT